MVRINMVSTGAGRSGPEGVASNRDRGGLALRIAAAVGRWSILAVGLIVSWNAAGWAGAGLDRVSVWHGYPEDLNLTSWRWDLTALSVASIVLLTGASRWRRGRVNVAQAVGAVWMGLWTGFWVFVTYAVNFPGGDEYDYDHDSCVWENCWPAGVQEPLAAAPLLIASLVMMAVAVFAHRLNWAARALIPTAVYLLLRIVQILIWHDVVLPFLIGT